MERHPKTGPDIGQALYLPDGAIAWEARRSRARLPPHSLSKLSLARHLQRARDAQPERAVGAATQARGGDILHTEQQGTNIANQGWLGWMVHLVLSWGSMLVRHAMWLLRGNTSIPDLFQCPASVINLAQPWLGFHSPMQIRLAPTRKQCKQTRNQYTDRRQRSWDSWQAAGYPWLVMESTYGAKRGHSPPSHSSSSDRRMGRWLMRGWNPERSPSSSRSRSRTRRVRRYQRRMEREDARAPTQQQTRDADPGAASSQAAPREPPQVKAAPPLRPASPPRLMGRSPSRTPTSQRTRDEPPSGSQSRPSMQRRSLSTWSPPSSPTTEPTVHLIHPTDEQFEAAERQPPPLMNRDPDGNLVLQMYWVHDGSPQMLHIAVTEPFPLTPAKIEPMIRQQYRRLAAGGRRFLVANSFQRGLVQILHPDEICVHGPEANGPLTVMYEDPYGADDLAIALCMIRQHSELSLLADAKVVKTLLASQAKLAGKVIAAQNDADRYDILVAAFKTQWTRVPHAPRCH